MNPAPPHHAPISRAIAAGRPGFTLSEVLVAIGILALGTVAVAALFPTAAFMQKEAVNETLRQNHIRSADAVLEGIGLRNVTLLEMVEYIETRPAGYPAYDVRSGIDEPAYDVFALAEMDIDIDSSYDISPQVPAMNAGSTPDMRMGDNTFGEDDSYVYDTLRYPLGNIPLSMRSLPTRTPPVDNGGTPSYVDREVFWVPLVRPGLEASELFPDWNVYVFILQPDSQLRTSNAYAMRTDGTIGVTFPGNYGFMNDADIVCANPDLAAYVPKVFRVPAAANGWNDNRPLEFTPDVNLFGYVKPGEKVLGDNGIIYRVS
ncbi:MAG: prepilin-type N-terminal cleavage/methylation domain-containing protein, partial [Planctomycetota bacterium]